MGRWEPNARGRLEQAALELYVERGYEQTTVAEITARAGLTERTFFRHFADKREVLFGGSRTLAELCVNAVAAAPATATALEATAAALDAAAGVFEERGDLVLQRQGVIDANAELRERELIKLASLSESLADALRERGVDELAARLAAEAAIAVLKVAFRRWVDAARRPRLRQLLDECFEVLRTESARGAVSTP
ncbi:MULTISPECIES: helix-turn-helix domain-containing protein [Streptomyces]|uniref:TetR/AcrR family transcriptional regulator n=1 Tax=Streptomyces TaxID=1883 RepID=UPI00240DDB9E|nr:MULTISPECIES: helix-turn-helix domain-containing protein [Streptomyces]WFB84022.1 TetR/AcrR family transcriptional regulator [Streptomyces olivaceus]WGK50357.1 TetR/AcrR family transcriptional regulator [Streptomyces sp. B146]